MTINFFHVVNFDAGFPAVMVRNLPTEASAEAVLPHFPGATVVVEPVEATDAERLSQIDREITADNLAEVAAMRR